MRLYFLELTMKKFILLFFIGIYCLSSSAQDTPDSISKNQLKETVSLLAADELKGRAIGSKGIEKAAQFIEKSLQKNNLLPYFETYRDTFKHQDKTGYNIVAYKKGTDPELKDDFVILSAHYDHIGVLTPVANDSIANGANDDASGTAAVLELARYFANKKTKRSLLFVLFSGEEVGLKGSSHLAQRLKNKDVNAYFMLNFEMIGVPMKRSYEAYLTGYDVSNLGDCINSYKEEEFVGNWMGEKPYQLFKRSDNYPFYKELNMPAHTLSSFDFVNFDEYHKVGDEIELIDFDFMQKLVRKIITPLEKLINSSTKEIQLRYN